MADNAFMAHVNCPNCGKRLRFSDTSDPLRIQCPICKHIFQPTAGSALTSQTSPASQSPAASDYSEANLGWVAKTSIIVMALAAHGNLNSPAAAMTSGTGGDT